MELPPLDPEFQVSIFLWILAAMAAFLVGLAKAGIKGIGIIIVTMLALSFGTKASTGILMPLLLAGDVFAVIYYNRHARWYYLVRLIPWMMAGVLLGVFIGKDMPEDIFKYVLAVIILISVIMLFWWERKERHYIPDNWWFAGIMGLTAGFTTMIGNLAGPFANLFFLAVRLPKNEFIGTTAWLFFIINLFKMPFHILVWKTINVQSILVDLRLLVFVVLGLIIGVKIVFMIRELHFRKLILFLTALGAILIFFK